MESTPPSLPASEGPKPEAGVDTFGEILTVLETILQALGALQQQGLLGGTRSPMVADALQRVAKLRMPAVTETLPAENAPPPRLVPFDPPHE